MTAFALLYSFGNILALGSTAFLMGPMSQLKKMFDNVRIVATGLYLVTMAATIFFAVKKNVGLTLLFLLLQMCALVWYSLSYIPYARSAAKKMVGSLC